MTPFRTKRVDPEEDLRKILRTLMPEPVVSLALDGRLGDLTSARVDFVFALVEGTVGDQFRSLTTKAIEISERYKAMVVANAGGIIQLAVGPRTDMADVRPYRSKLAQEIAEIDRKVVRVVHGRALAHVGTVGTETRKMWGFFPTHMSGVLKALLQAAPGSPMDLGDLGD